MNDESSVSSFYTRGWLQVHQQISSLFDKDNSRFGIFADYMPPERPTMRIEGNDVMVENSRVRFVIMSFIAPCCVSFSAGNGGR
jgi:hypothetical protein